MKKYIYKVVRQWDGKQGKSAVIRPGAYCLTYRLGKKTKTIPGTVGILAFYTLDYALNFAVPCVGLASILKCSFGGKVRRMERFSLLNVRKLSRSTLMSKEIYDRYRYYTPPEGTVSVDSITPIKVLEF